MARLGGKDGLLTWSGLKWRIHAWQVDIRAAVFDDTGDAARVSEYFIGDKSARGTIVMSLDDADPAGKRFPQPGTTISGVQFRTIEGTVYTSTIKIVRSGWGVEKRRGGPQQRVEVEFVTDDNSAGSLLNPSNP